MHRYARRWLLACGVAADYITLPRKCEKLSLVGRDCPTNVGNSAQPCMLGVSDRWIRQLVNKRIIKQVDDSRRALFNAEECSTA
jgi:hypothetical protein